MDDYNANIIYKCLSNELGYIYGLHAIKRELKRNNYIKMCESCNRKHLTEFYTDEYECTYLYEKVCHECSHPNEKQEHIKFDHYTILTNKRAKISCLPNEIISLIFNNLSEYEVMNFCIAMHACNREIFIIILFWSQLYCASCLHVKKKYFNCYSCEMMACLDCTQQCACCDNRIRLHKKEDLHIDSKYYLGDYKTKYGYLYKYKQNICLHFPDSCTSSWIHLYGKPSQISKKEYHNGVICITCNKFICYNCIRSIENGDCWNYNYYCINCCKQ